VAVFGRPNTIRVGLKSCLPTKTRETHMNSNPGDFFAVAFKNLTLVGILERISRLYSLRVSLLVGVTRIALDVNEGDVLT
jgi:hypothetical protein